MCVLGVKYANNVRGYFNFKCKSLPWCLSRLPSIIIIIISYFVLFYGFCIFDPITILLYSSTLLYPSVFYYTFLVKCTKLGLRTSLKRSLEQKRYVFLFNTFPQLNRRLSLNARRHHRIARQRFCYRQACNTLCLSMARRFPYYGTIFGALFLFLLFPLEFESWLER